MGHGRAAGAAHRVSCVDVVAAAADAGTTAQGEGAEAGRAACVGAGRAVGSERGADDAGAGGGVEVGR